MTNKELIVSVTNLRQYNAKITRALNNMNSEIFNTHQYGRFPDRSFEFEYRMLSDDRYEYLHGLGEWADIVINMERLSRDIPLNAFSDVCFETEMDIFAVRDFLENVQSDITKEIVDFFDIRENEMEMEQ